MSSRLLAISLVAAVATRTIAPSTDGKPNIIILFGDDIGHGDLGVFGHPTSRTPNLNKMAAEGAKLTMYESAANVCSPSRASILTGRYYTRTGAYPGVFSPNSVGGLPLNETTIATALKPAGYTSGMVGKWHLGTNEYHPTNHGFDFYFGAPMTQNECTSNIKYPGSSVYHPAAAQAAMALAPNGSCGTPYILHGVGLSTNGAKTVGAKTPDECCAACMHAGKACAAWTFHSTGSSCVVSEQVLPHISSGTSDATSGSKTPIPPKPWPPAPAPSPHHGGGSGFGPCPIFNGSDASVWQQYDLMRTPEPHLYDMLGIDEQYDAATEGFIRSAVAQSKPFFFYFCSHHTHAPQFAPDSFLGYSRRGLAGDSLGLIDRSAGRLLNLTRELDIDSNTMLIFSADNGGSLAWRELGGVNGDLRCGKGTTYEGGHRVPLIARWPGKIAPNTIIDELTSSLDWFPTILGLAGVPLPADRVIDGVDQRDLLFGVGPSKRKDFLYFEWRTAKLMAVRIGKWKLHVQVRGSHCSAPFIDAACYNDDFRNASAFAADASETGSCTAEQAGNTCMPMLVNLDTDPGETQLLTKICPPVTPAGQLDPRCYTYEELAPIVHNLTVLFNTSAADTSLWAPSQIRRGSNAAERFPCCSPNCSPKPYCCKCGKGERGPVPPTTEQDAIGINDEQARFEQFLGPELIAAGITPRYQ